MDWEYVCIFEDDALPCKEIVNKLEHYLNVLPEDADILKMGHLRYIDNPIKLSQDFIRVLTYGSHSYMVFKRYYQDYIDIASNKDLHVDRLCMNNPTKNIYTTNECLFIQEDSMFKDTVLHKHLKDMKFMESEYVKNNFERWSF